jgi:hypothetical protein
MSSLVIGIVQPTLQLGSRGLQCCRRVAAQYVAESDTARQPAGRTACRVVIRLDEPLHSDSGMGTHCSILSSDLAAKGLLLLSRAPVATLVLLLGCSSAGFQA